MSLMQSSTREHELHALLTQKDFELEERSRLLHKSKVTIEQLQEEIVQCRHDLENAEGRIHTKEQIISQQQGQLRSTQEKQDALQLDLECQKAENSAIQESLTSKTVELQRCKGEFQSFRENANDLQRKTGDETSRTREEVRSLIRKADATERESEQLKMDVEAMRGKLRASETAVAERDSTIRGLKEKTILLKGDLEARDTDLADAAGRIRRLQDEQSQLRTQLHQAGLQVKDLSIRAEELLLEKQAVAKEHMMARETCEQLSSKLKAAEAAVAEERSALDRKAKDEAGAQALAARRAAEASESEQQWAEKLLSATARFESTMMETEREWVRKVSEVEKDWAQRLESAERRWGREKTEIEKQAEQQVQELETQWESHFRQMQQKLSSDLNESTHRLQSEKAATEMVYSQQLQEAESRWVAEKVAVERKWSEEKAGTERRFQLLMDDARQHWKNEKLELNSKWERRLVEAEKAWQEEKASVEAAWAARVDEVEVLAMRQQDALRFELEERVGSVSQKLQDLAQREAKREAKRQDLMDQVEQLRNTTEEEYSRRVELEHTLQNVNSSFRREMTQKDHELQALQHELSQSVVMESSLRMDDSLRQSDQFFRSSQYRPSPSPVHPSAHRPPQLSGCLPSPMSPTPAAEIERELRSLRQAREQFHNTIVKEEEKRNELLSRISSKMKGVSVSGSYASGTPASHGQPSPLHSSVPTAGNGTPNLERVQAELSGRLGSAIRRLEPSLSTRTHTLGSPH